MTKSTTDTAPSSPLSQEEKDDMQRRTASIQKAVLRLTEIAGYLDRIENVVGGNLPEFIAKHPLGETVDGFQDLRDAVDSLETGFKKIKARIDYVREVTFPERLDAEETRTFTAQTGSRVTRTERVFASIMSGPSPDETIAILGRAYEWLRANDLGPLIKETVNSSALSGAAKELMENGKELPDDLFRTFTKDGVSITRPKKKAA